MILGSIFVLQHELKSRTLKVGPTIAGFSPIKRPPTYFPVSISRPFFPRPSDLVVNNIILKT